MLPGITPSLIVGGGTGNDSFTKLLLHFDGTGLMNVAMGGTPSVATPHSTPIHTGEKKFGSSSVYFQGGANSFITIKNSPDFDFGTGNFTIDWWEKRFSVANGTGVIKRQADNSPQAFLLNHAVTGAGPRYQTYMSSNGSTWDIAGGIDCGSIDLEVWVHYAVVRNGNTFYHFKNGVQTSTWSSSAALLTAPVGSGVVVLGNWAGLGYHGYIDELRISKGIARWTTNFTPPASAYGPTPDRSAWHTVGLYHFDNPTNADGTTFTDSSPYAKPVTLGNGFGHPTPKFGTGSAYFSASGTRYVQLPSDEDWNLGSGEFTFDWWEYRLDAVDNTPTIVRAFSKTYQPILFGYQYGGNVLAYASSDAANWDIFSALNLGSITINDWSHRAIVRSNNGTVYAFKDGVITDTRTGVFGSTYYVNDTGMFIGVWNLDASQSWGNLLIDELRISKGIARWTANFTPPTGPYTG